jgi:hypothetical protein
MSGAVKPWADDPLSFNYGAASGRRMAEGRRKRAEGRGKREEGRR